MSETASAPASENDMRPIVRTGGSGKAALWLFGGAVLLGGLLLFNGLNARRAQMVVSTALPQAQAGDMIAAPPPLSVPQDIGAQPQLYPAPLTAPPYPTVRPEVPQPQVVTRVVERLVPAPTPAYAQPPEQLYPSRTPLVIEQPSLAGRSSTGAETASSERVTADRLRNPSLTIPQGTIVAAVLETALDSTRAGAVRAIVSRDVRSFDGSRVLIPRGSRLYGEYASELSPGQKRALVRWRRLTRPDAVIIDLDSPAADPLGRAGIGGKVDTHFFERFGGQIVQTALDVGVAAATQSIVNYPVIVALPPATAATGQSERQVQSTLKVQQGTSVSVFVARDLDFSTVER